MAGQFKVLVVDDDPVVLEVARGRLESLGYQTTTHDRGLGTNRIVLKTEPHVVLLDVEMPGLDGDQLVDLIQENQWERDQPWPAVILHSGKGDAELEQVARRTQAAGSIAKTPDSQKFIRQFQAIIEAITR